MTDLKLSTSYEIGTRISRVSCQKGPTHHAYAWQLGPFWQDTIDLCFILLILFILFSFDVITIVYFISIDLSYHQFLVTSCE